MKADEHGVLLHTYYGKRTEQMDFSYLIQKRDHGFSGNPYDAETDRKYSLDTLPQEYSCQGNGDYRESTFAVRNQYGVSASDLRFQGYEILKGKYEDSGFTGILRRRQRTGGHTCDIHERPGRGNSGKALLWCV